MAKKKQNQIIGAGGGGAVVRQLFNKPYRFSSLQHRQSEPQRAQRTTWHLLPLATFLICFAKARSKDFRLRVITPVAQIITTKHCLRMFI
jgi:hypothetical protein